MRDLLNKRIPTLAGLFLIVIGVLATSYLINTGVIYLGGAAPSDNPLDVRISNISDRSVSITYKTTTKILGTVSIGQSKDALQTILDERDQQSGIPRPYMLHSITVKNLKPDTAYVFSITSGTTTYLNHDTYFTTRTAPTMTQNPSSLPPVAGNVLGSNGKAPEEGLVFVSVANGQLLSTLTKPSGSYAIPLNVMLRSDLHGSLALSDTTPLNILATDGTDSSQAITTVANSNPTPLITLSNNYNFSTSTTPLASSSGNFGFPSVSFDQSLEATPVIITPKKDESFVDTKPQFTGKALPNETVTIEIHSDTVVNASVTSDSTGTWSYRPTTPLSPGQHIISITTKNAAGILQTIQQSFTVYAEGSQVSQSATPSATPVVSTSPTATPTSKPKPGVSVTPTIAITPTPTTIPQLISVSPTPRPTLPPTGSNSVVTLGISSIVVTAAGIVLFVLTHGVPL